MTPKEKAIELVNKMAFEVCITDAKQCALIAVDEMLSFFSNKAFELTYPEISKFEITYWKEVKQEIEIYNN